MANGRRPLNALPGLLRDSRFVRQLSLRDAATEMGVSPATLNRIENGSDHMPDLDSLQRIAQWLGLEIALFPAPASSSLPPDLTRNG